MRITAIIALIVWASFQSYRLDVAKTKADRYDSIEDRMRFIVLERNAYLQAYTKANGQLMYHHNNCVCWGE